MSHSLRKLFEQIPRTTNKTRGSWLKFLLHQGQLGPSGSAPPHPKEITMNTYIPTQHYLKVYISTSGAKIQFHAFYQLLSLLAKEERLAVFHWWVVVDMCEFYMPVCTKCDVCAQSCRLCLPSCGLFALWYCHVVEFQISALVKYASVDHRDPAGEFRYPKELQCSLIQLCKL